ncbi:hypothetical protein AVEN_55609-1 [Araneus ventricosus]|uniref:Uncharacterized protein n=1 Tax=Araneus ventricosus TaxID=182803 RepID=A0A4Y2QBZ1_ARAVE|nr:hypothetical protein AVEN_55609-1 [Araneus ventricosus]
MHMAWWHYKPFYISVHAFTQVIDEHSTPRIWRGGIPNHSVFQPINSGRSFNSAPLHAYGVVAFQTILYFSPSNQAGHSRRSTQCYSLKVSSIPTAPTSSKRELHLFRFPLENLSPHPRIIAYIVTEDGSW